MASGRHVGTIGQYRAETHADHHVTKRSHLREAVAGLLIVLTCLLFTVAIPAVWAKRNFLDTTRFVQRAGPLAKDPAVQQALTVRISDEISTVIRPDNLFRSALPERGKILVVPLTAAVQQFVQKVVASFVQSTAFQKLWTGTLKVTHTAAMAVLNGHHQLFVERNGVVTLNLVPMINAILTAINKVTPDVLGHNIKLPTITASDQANSAAERLSAALNDKLPNNFGQVVVYNRKKLAAVQEAVHLFQRFVILSVVGTLVFAVAALGLTKRRRRGLIFLAVGVTLGMVLVRRGVFRIEHDVTNLPPKETGRQAAAVVLHAFLSPLTTFAAWAIGVAIAVTAVAWVTSGSPRAVRLRRWVARMGRSAKEHRGLLQGAGVALAIILLWSVDWSALGILLVIALLGVYELVVTRMAGEVEPSSGGAGSQLRRTA
jgi:hypothetical protein